MKFATLTAQFGVALLAMTPCTSFSAPPTEKDVDTYSQLCKIGSQSTLSASLTLELAALARRLLAGEAKLAGSKLQDEFPGIRDEKNRLIALQSFQDCMYRYVERFHPAIGVQSTLNTPAPNSAEPPKPPASRSPNRTKPRQQTPEPRDSAPTRSESHQPAAFQDPSTSAPNPVGPEIAPERRREIIYIANELDTFKQKMARAITAIPEKLYDKRDSTEKRPRADHRLVGLDDFTRYKAFQSATGGLDFSNATNNDIALLCSTYTAEIWDYYKFSMQYRTLALPPYDSTSEAKRICTSAGRGR